MENRMYGTHRIRKSDGERMSTWAGYNFEWSQILFRKFLRRTGGAEVLGFDEDLFSNPEFWSRLSFSVHRSLIAFLSFGHLISEELVKFVKV
jgi:hypothetical protein